MKLLNKGWICIYLIAGILIFPTTLYAQLNSQYVNPFIGTGGHGHTFPGATLPFGMVQLSPDTRVDGSWDGCSGYHYSDSIIYGFSHTHLSGTGVSDYGDILLMPTTGRPVLEAVKEGNYKNGYASHFTHKNESALPGYYSVHLDDDNIDVELTATTRTGFHKYTYPQSDQSNIILDLTHRDKTVESSVKVINHRYIEGMRRSAGWAPNQVIYFVVEFSKTFDSYGLSENDSLRNNISEASGTNVKAYFRFTTSKDESIYIKVGISAVNIEDAKENIDAENSAWDFEAVRINAQSTWDYELGKIAVSGVTLVQKRIFYTALYHCMIAPNVFNDVNKKYLGHDFKIHQANHFDVYTVFSLWDTFRGLHPLLSIIETKRTSDFLKSLLAIYHESGRLPVWPLAANETDCMIGYHSVSVIADAAVKEALSVPYPEVFDAMKHSADTNLFGLKAYQQQGYISMDDDGSSVSKTLEYAYDDWCIAQFAMQLNDSADYKVFIQRAQNWKNIFDPKTGFMRPKKNGNFLSPFDPYEVSFNYTEANAWQYAFFAPQDIDGLIHAFGGKAKAAAKLDYLFSTNSQTTGREQSDITGMIGQYVHGNEPSHHMAYLYDYMDAPWKTQKLVHQIMSEFYKDAPDGLIGNEDCGQMSAWYVLSAMGFYSVTPGSPYYALGTPAFDTVRIYIETKDFEHNKPFTIIAHHLSDKSFYIQSMLINGNPTDSLFISNASILRKETVEFEMGPEPKTNWSKQARLAPASSINDFQIAVDPVIIADHTSFHDSLKIEVKSFQSNVKLYYTLNNADPDYRSTRYTIPFFISKTDTVKAIAINQKGQPSHMVSARFIKTDNDWKLNYIKNYNSQYTGGGDEALFDGISGSSNFSAGTYQGWWGDDMEVIIDLGKIKNVSFAGAEFLQDMRSWILMPEDLEVKISLDGKTYSDPVITGNTVPDKEENPSTEILGVAINKEARYIKIKATNYGILPSWHPGAGNKAWIFCDEIFIK
ncbi:MAG: glycoside hydrolase family 92 protein [Chitinophagales bacterium]|nr:glycoside hydrolase family 92 protein [Chitinophagales bacterium]